MPISPFPAAEPGQRGLTLIEVLVVLAIIAITTSVSVLAIGSDEGLRGQAEARRIEARLQLAADQTMIDDTPLALAIAPDGYRFLKRDGAGQWQASDDPTLGGEFTLPAGMELRSADGGAIFPLGADASGLAFTLVLEWQQRRWAIAFDGMTARSAPAGAVGEGQR